MNKEAQEFLDAIRAKEPIELNEDEVAFLRARSSYLTGDQREKFAEVLGDDAKPRRAAKKGAEAEDGE